MSYQAQCETGEVDGRDAPDPDRSYESWRDQLEALRAIQDDQE